jgi:hypothetical protein
MKRAWANRVPLGMEHWVFHHNIWEEHQTRLDQRTSLAQTRATGTLAVQAIRPIRPAVFHIPLFIRCFMDWHGHC